MIKKNINMYLFLILNAYLYLFGINTFTKISGKATILSLIIASIIGYILLILFLNSKKNETLSLKNTKIFHKILIGIAIIPILLSTLKKVTAFINYNILDTVSIYLILLGILIPTLYIVYKNMDTILKSSVIFFYIFIFLFLITFIFSFNKIDINNLLNIIDTGYNNIISSSLIFLIILLSPYTFLYFMDYKVKENEINNLKKGYILNSLFIIFWFIVILGILGINLTNLYPYPEVFILKKISFLNIIDRMESIFSITIFLSFFTLLSSLLYAIVSLFPKKIKEITLIIIGTILFFSYQIIRINSIYLIISIFLFFLFTSVINTKN